MAQPPRSVLIVDDSPEDCASIRRRLERDRTTYRCSEARTAAAAREHCRAGMPDVVLLDYGLPDCDGLTLLAELLDTHGPHAAAMLMLTGVGNQAIAVQAMKLGAHDYLVKGPELDLQLGRAVAGAVEKVDMQRRVASLLRDLESNNRQLRQAAAEMHSREAFNQAVLNSIGAHIAVLDRTGTIVAVNSAWERFAHENGRAGDAVDIGVNYLAVCCAGATAGLPEAELVHVGIKQVLDGLRQDFAFEYPCGSQDEQHWFVMNVTPLRAPPGGAVVAHHPITQRKRAEAKLRDAQAQLSAHAARLESLQAAATSLAGLLDRDRVTAAILEHAVAAIGACCGAVFQLQPGEHLQLLSTHGFSPADIGKLAALSLDVPTVFTDAIRTAAPVYVLSPAERDARYPHLARLRISNNSAAVAFPLIVDRRVIGSLGLLFSEPQQFPPEDLNFMAALARQCAQALDRALLYEQIQATTRGKDEALTLLDTLFAAAPVGLAFLDRELRFVRINEALAELNGWPAAAHIGRRLAEIVPAQAPELEPLYRSVLATGQPIINRESSLVPPGTADQVRHWIENYYPVAAPGQPPLGVGVVVIDVTAIKHTAAALHETERKLATLVDLLPIGISILDADKRVVYVNPELERILGMPRAALFAGSYLGREYLRADGTPMPSQEFPSLRALAEQRTVSNIETGIIKEDGSVTWTSSSAVPVVFPDWSVVVAVSEIGERKRAEEAVQRQNEILREQAALLDQAHVLVRDADNRIVFWNAGAQALYGWTADQAIGQVSHQLLHTQFPVSFEAYQQQLYRAGHWAGELVHTKRDGSQMVVASHQVLHQHGSGRAFKILEVNNDITERRRVETALRESQRQLHGLSVRLVNAQEDERRALSYELHDEIGQQLTGLNMVLEAGADASLDYIHAKLRSAQQMVTDLTSRVRQLSLDLRPPMLDDFGLLSTLIWHTQRYSEQTRIAVDFKHSGFGATIAPHVAIAAYRIMQEGLTNIARHARVGQAVVRVWLSHGQLKIAIEDRGCGFDLAAALQAPRSVGLSAMRERAQLLGGHFTIDAAPGEGTRIFASLPLDAAPEAHEEAT